MRYHPNHHGVGNYLKGSPGLKRVLYLRAALGLSTAVALAPRRTGALAASGRIVDEGSRAGVRHDRMGFRVEFTVPYVVPVTFGHDHAHPERAYLDAAKSVMGS